MVVIGIDPGATTPAIAEWPTGYTWQLAGKGKDGARLAGLARAVHDWTLLSTPDDLTAIFIERPIGKYTPPELLRAAGVIEATVLNAMREQFPHEPMCVRLSPGEWKKGAGMKGNAKKQEVHAWATDLTGRALTQDEADALAIAAAGYALLTNEEETNA